ncbi:helix-turn-helix transcriptional regulator [Leucobacter japonicus]|uniref:helix-turn-helix transcriptional regulator n=1 Tax=Leucobacter japonicus TaxID=1461259 RepID=UPI0009E245E0
MIRTLPFSSDKNTDIEGTIPREREVSVLGERRPMRILRAYHRTVVEPVAHTQAKVVIVTAGWTRLEHLKQVTDLAEGDVAILPAQALVGGVPLPTAETVTFYFDPLFLEQQTAWTSTVTPVAAALRTAAAGIGPILRLRPSLLRRGTLTARARALSACDASSESVGLGLVAASLGFLASIEQVPPPSSSALPRLEVRAVVTALQNDLARRWTISDLSQLVHLSGSQLTRVLDAELGAPPMQVLMRLRAERLSELLLMTNWTVQRCAESVGWSDPGYASRIMKRFYGTTPNDYRKAAYM